MDKQDRLSIGRPWLTLAVDVGAQMVTGFSVSLDGPSTLSGPLVLTHAVTPNELWLADLGVDVELPVSGIPKRLHLGNAKEFQSAALARISHKQIEKGCLFWHKDFVQKNLR